MCEPCQEVHSSELLFEEHCKKSNWFFYFECVHFTNNMKEKIKSQLSVYISFLHLTEEHPYKERPSCRCSKKFVDSGSLKRHQKTCAIQRIVSNAEPIVVEDIRDDDAPSSGDLVSVQQTDQSVLPANDPIQEPSQSDEPALDHSTLNGIVLSPSMPQLSQRNHRSRNQRNNTSKRRRFSHSRQTSTRSDAIDTTNGSVDSNLHLVSSEVNSQNSEQTNEPNAVVDGESSSVITSDLNEDETSSSSHAIRQQKTSSGIINRTIRFQLNPEEVRKGKIRRRSTEPEQPSTYEIQWKLPTLTENLVTEVVYESK